jgi:hypothetical protein
MLICDGFCNAHIFDCQNELPYESTIGIYRLILLLFDAAFSCRRRTFLSSIDWCSLLCTFIKNNGGEICHICKLRRSI